MITNNSPFPIQYRDGSSRTQGAPNALLASELNFEQRDAKDWLRFAQEFSRLVHYYNEANQPEGYWDGFLAQSPNASPEDLEAFRNLLNDYLGGQLPVNAAAETVHQLQAPHRALFLAFLKLLNPIKDQFNTLPQRHLDFHFRNLLGLAPLDAIADSVHVQVQLEEETEAQLLPAGTLFAVPQEEGPDLEYRSDHALPLNQISLEKVHQSYLQKRIETLEQVRENHRSDVDKGFAALLSFVLGADGPGTALPPLPDEQPTLNDYFIELGARKNLSNEQQLSDPYWHYLRHHLFLTFDDLGLILQTQDREIDASRQPYPNAWKKVYELLKVAYLNKEVARRKEKLKTIYEEAETALNQGQADGMDANELAKLPNGLRAMLRYAFANPTTHILAPYNNQELDLLILSNHLQNGDSNQQGRARNYLQDEWSMTTGNFERFYALMQQSTRTPIEWDEALGLLEEALREHQRLPATVPSQTHIKRLFALTKNPEVVASDDDISSHHSWPIFGQANPEMEAKRGWTLQSPLLILAEGEREIHWYLRVQGSDPAQLPRIFETSDIPIKELPFHTELLAGGVSHPVTNPEVSYGNFILEAPLAEWNGTVNQQGFELGPGQSVNLFTQDEQLILTSTGDLYRLEKATSTVKSPTIFLTALDEETYSFPPSGKVLVFDPQTVFYSSLHLKLSLAPEFPAISSDAEHGHPQLTLYPNPAFVPAGEPIPNWLGLQHALRDYQLDLMHLGIKVRGLEIKTIQNDQGNLDSQTPYQPFGQPAVKGNSFYFSHSELVSKPLTEMTLQFLWPNTPAEFKEYYKEYYQYLKEVDPKRNNNTYHGKLSLVMPYRTIEISGQLPLFAENEALQSDKASSAVAVASNIAQASPDFDYHYHEVTPEESVLDWSHYFQLEYNGSSFLDEEYQVIQVPFYLATQNGTDHKAPAPLNKPYLPTLKSLKADYQAKETFLLTSENDYQTQAAYQVPFGKVPFPKEQLNPIPLLFSYPNSGELYLGLKNAQPNQSISMLFQMVEGSGPAHVPKPDVKWYYQSTKGWDLMGETHQLLDRTQGLSQTGIKIIQLPADIATGSTELDPDLCWIKAVAENYAEGLPECSAILTAVAHATQHGEAPEGHFLQPLPPNSITEIEPPNLDVRSIRQPFSSLRGKAPESDENYYLRVSKRLRHKQRALTMWDYEQLVLEHFQEVFKAKCLSADHKRFDTPGSVRVIVIPDVRGKIPFAPLQPKLADYQLDQIQNYLQSVTPAYANVVVTHPEYLHIKVRLGVKIHPGYLPEKSLAQLNLSIKQFLSPWAYNATDEISFGGEVYANALIGYIENLDYVDYVTNIKLFESTNGIHFTEVFAEDGFLKVSAHDTQTVLISARHHELDLIGPDGYVVEKFSGINFDKIELDFRVGS